jgi:HK97 family phage major capsid protein
MKIKLNRSESGYQAEVLPKRAATPEDLNDLDAAEASFTAARAAERAKLEKGIRDGSIKPHESDEFGFPLDMRGRNSSDDRYHEVWEKYIRHGMGALTPEEHPVLHTGFRVESENRAQSKGVTTAGGFSVPDAIYPMIEQNKLAFGGLYASDAVRKLATPDGRTIPWPTDDDTSNTVALLAENAEDTAVNDVTFGQVNVGAFRFSTGFIKCSYEFLADTSVDVSSWIAEKLGTRYARGIAPYLINGDGTGEPQGLDAGGLGKTFASPTAITRSEILDLVASIDPAYRNSPSFRLVLSDSMLTALMKLTVGSSDDRPLWQPSVRDGVPPTLEGYKYVVDAGVASMAASAHSIYAGDLSKFVIREVNRPIILRLTERGAEFGQVWFIGMFRMDSRILDAGTDPLKYGRHPAS